MNMMRFLMAGVLLCVSVNASAAEKAVVLMQRFFDTVQTLQADFKQTLDTPKGSRQASGRLWLSRPGQFRWVYDQPEPQEIVSDGKTLWLYDKGLDQVIERNLSGAIDNTPAALLAGSQALTTRFNVTALPMQDGLYGVELTPKSKDNQGFEKVRMRFADNAALLQTMELVDELGQTVQLRFTRVQVNPKLGAAQFRFVAPAGVDVLRQ